MTDTLNVVPAEKAVKTGVENTRSVAEGLSDVLADTYALAVSANRVGSGFVPRRQ